MASTAEGKTLTARHQRLQLAIAATAAREARALWSRLNLDDLDGSLPYWLAATTGVLDRRIRQSQEAAGEYLQAYRVAEIGSATAVTYAAAPGTPQALRFAGPVRVKRLIGGGMEPEDAYTRALVKFDGIVRRQTLMGGRMTIAASTGRDRRAIGWRRVTDGNPCAFCAMLASRGPVYRDATTADGVQYHAHCGCTAEPAYSQWEPSAEEQRFREAYDDVAVRSGRYGAVDTKATLAAMRRLGIFRDSV